MNPENFPILASGDTAIMPVTGFAWLVILQQHSDADAAITALMARQMERASKLPCVTCGQLPKPPPPDFASFPEFSTKGVGSFCIADAAWLALVRRGDSVNQGPNPTEAALLHFHQKFGKKIPRPNA